MSKKKDTISETIYDAVIETTDHALLQLVDRYFFNSYAHIIGDREELFYPDVSGSNVFYFNLIPTGFVVLRRTDYKKFVIMTITQTENRDFGIPIKLINPRLKERQGEYVQ